MPLQEFALTHSLLNKMEGKAIGLLHIITVPLKNIARPAREFHLFNSKVPEIDCSIVFDRSSGQSGSW